jgi:acyl-CoA dehydrogenase
MMRTILTEQYERLLNGLSDHDPWPELVDSGFLDMLRGDFEGGAGLPLEELFPLALATGHRVRSVPILETMVARLVDSKAVNIADVEEALGQIPAARPLAAALAAAQMTGAMERIMRMTLDHATTRRQFGREIGKFQAVQHSIAVMVEEVLAARIAAEAALQGRPLQISECRAGAAKLRAGEAARQVSAIAHAVHGAMGISHEHELHFYTRRLRTWQMAHGGEAWWAARLGELVLSSADDMAGFVQTM